MVPIEYNDTSKANTTTTNDKLVSVIIPVYNCFDYIDMSIASVVNQTYKHLEIIIVNDGSTDYSDIKCKEYAGKDSRIKYIEVKNGGVSNARNIGIDHANGEYITFIDADDWISLDYVEVLYKQLIQTNTDISMCGLMNVRENTGIHYTTDSPNGNVYLLNRENSLMYFMYGKGIGYGVCCKLYKRDLIIRNSIRFPVGWKNAEDISFLLEMLNCIHTVSMNLLPLYFYVKRMDSASHRKTLTEDDFNIIKLFDRMSFVIKKAYPSLTKACNYLQLRARIEVLKKAYKREGVNENTIKELRHYIFNHRFNMLNRNIRIYDKVMFLLLILGKRVFTTAEVNYFKIKNIQGEIRDKANNHKN